MNPTGSKACQKVRGGDRDSGHSFGNGPQGAEFPLSNKIMFAMTLDPTAPSGRYMKILSTKLFVRLLKGL